MSWQENQQFLTGGEYKSASFRGVPFWVQDYQKEFGRRQSIQKFPGDKYTAVQDLGEDSPNFTVNAFVVGTFYDDQRNDLEAALNKGGEGDLYLPWRGTLKVTVVGRPRTSENKDERGYCVISFDCVVTAPPPKLFSPDNAQTVRNMAGQARNETQSKFQQGYSIIHQPQANKLKIRDGIDLVSGAMVGIQSAVSSQMNVITSGANQVSRLVNRMNTVINLPFDFSEVVIDAVVTTYSSLRSTSDLLENVVTTWGRGGPLRILADQTFPFLLGFNTPTVPTQTAAGAQEQRNIDQFYRHFRLQLFYEAASVMTELPFQSYQQAARFRTEYIEVADQLMLDVDGDEFEAFAALNAAVVNHVSEVANELPQLGTFTPADTLPALVVAHLMYGDASLESEIVQRNDIPDPNFVPQGEPLEVVLFDG